MHLSDSTQFYSNKELFSLEQEKIFNNSWLMLCHESEIPQNGQYLTFQIASEPIVIIRTPSKELKAFFNICVHRGFPLFTNTSGQIDQQIRCGYHGWRYDGDGKVISEAGCASANHQLKQIQLKIELGFVFVNLKNTSPTEFTAFEKWSSEIASHNIDQLRPVRESVFEKVLNINWKFFIENTLEGHHVSSVHPGLEDLIGSEYQIEFGDKVSKTTALIKGSPQRFWSEKMYASILKQLPAKTSEATQKWLFYFVFPNVQISIYPEQVFHLQAIPIAVDKTLIRGRYFNWPQTTRLSQIAEYLNLRIGRKVYREDLAILNRIKGSLSSKEFDQLTLVSEKDRVIKHFHDCHAAALQNV